MISHMLDTNICIDIIRGEHPHLLTRLNRYDPENAGISSIVFAELHTGVCKSSKPAHNLEKLTDFCTPLLIVPFDSIAAESYGFVRAHLEAAGTPIGPLDMLIAAHALTCKCILVANNSKEFSRVHGLQVEYWLAAPSAFAGAAPWHCGGKSPRGSRLSRSLKRGLKTNEHFYFLAIAICRFVIEAWHVQHPDAILRMVAPAG